MSIDDALAPPVEDPSMIILTVFTMYVYLITITISYVEMPFANDNLNMQNTLCENNIGIFAYELYVHVFSVI